jgi:hypothetical protein
MHSQKGNKNAPLFKEDHFYSPFDCACFVCAFGKKEKNTFNFFFPLLVTLRNLEVK